MVFWLEFIGFFSIFIKYLKFPFFWFLHFWNVLGAFFYSKWLQTPIFSMFLYVFILQKNAIFCFFFIWKMDLFFPFFLFSFFSNIKHFKALKSCCRPFPCLALFQAFHGLFLPCWQCSTSQSSLFFSIEKEKRSERSIFKNLIEKILW